MALCASEQLCVFSIFRTFFLFILTPTSICYVCKRGLATMEMRELPFSVTQTFMIYQVAHSKKATALLFTLKKRLLALGSVLSRES